MYKLLIFSLILASTQQGEWVLDPFCGSSTTGIAANLLGRRFLGIDQERDFVMMSKNRREELNDTRVFNKYRSKIKDIHLIDDMQCTMFEENANLIYGDLPF